MAVQTSILNTLTAKTKSRLTCHRTTVFFTSTTSVPNHKISSSSGSSIHHPRAFHSKLKCYLFKNSSLTHLIIHPSNLNDTHPISYSVSSDLQEDGPELTMDPFGKPI